MEKFKLLHVFPLLSVGGTEKVIFQISDYIRTEIGAEVGIATSTRTNVEGIEIVHVPQLLRKKRVFHNIISLSRAISKFEPDVIHTHSLYTLVLTYLATRQRLRFTPLIVHTGHGGPQKNYERYAAWVAWMADVYVAISRQSLADMKKSRKKLTNVKLVPNGVEKPDDYEVSTSPEVKEKLRLGFVGRLTTQKGLNVLFDALHYLNSYGVPFELAVIGDGELREELESFVVSSQLQHSITFHGFVHSPWALLRDSTVMVIPSLWEPGGIVAMESIVRGHTVVASCVGGLQDTVQDGVTGYFFEVGNSEILASILSDIYTGDKKRLSISEETKNNFYFDHTTGPTLLGIYKERLKKRS